MSNTLEEIIRLGKKAGKLGADIAKKVLGKLSEELLGHALNVALDWALIIIFGQN